MKSTDFLNMPTNPIRAALERLISAYDEHGGRWPHSLMLALMRALPHLCWFSQRHHDGELPFGSADWFIVGANLPTGAITYHLPIELLSLARQTGAAELSAGHPWDGHTASDVIKRLRTWMAAAIEPDPAGGGEALLAAAPAEGEVGELGRLVAELEVAAVTVECEGGDHEAAAVRRAATLLQQQAAELATLRERIELAAVAAEPSDDELEEVWDLGHLPTDEELANDDGEQDLQFLHTSAYYRWLEEHPNAKDEDQRKRIRAVFNAGRHWGKQQALPQGVEVE